MNKIIDAKDAILGRLASYSAKMALLGHEIAIVNCEEIIISGKPKMVIREYRGIRQKGGSNLQGPYFPKATARIVKRTIRGMLDYKSGRGKDAFKRIKCYDGVPKEFEDAKKIIAGKEKKTKTIKLKDLSKEI